MRIYRSLTLMLCFSSLTACETINVRRDFKSDGKARAVFVDAKQRAVTIVPVRTQTVTQVRTGQTTTTSTVTSVPLRICAEPSPDALTAIATAASARASVKGQVDISGAIQRAESAASIGLRTQSVTLMRDVLYRICEQYQSGALTPAGVETLERRYQSSLVAILAIEQLTGAVRAAAVTLGSNSSTGGADAVAAIYAAKVKTQASSSAADKKLAGDKASLVTSQAALTALLADGGEADPAKMDAARKAKYDPLKKKVDDDIAAVAASEADVKIKIGELKDATAALAAVGSGDGSAAATGAALATSTPALSDTATATVAAAVQSIVTDTLQLGFLRESCATLMVASIEGRSAINPGSGGTPASFADSCKAYFDAAVAQLNADTNHTNAITSLIAKNDGSTASLEALAKVLTAFNGAQAQAGKKPPPPRPAVPAPLQ